MPGRGSFVTKFHLESNEQLRNRMALMQEGMFASSPGQPKQILNVDRPVFKYAKGQKTFISKVRSSSPRR